MTLGVALSTRDLPSHAEADVGKADTAVDEENGKTRQGEKPVEDHIAVLSQVDECEAAEQELHDNDIDGATLLVDLGQELGCHACFQVRIVVFVIFISATYH
jgi:hypothetical protein